MDSAHLPLEVALLWHSVLLHIPQYILERRRGSRNVFMHKLKIAGRQVTSEGEDPEHEGNSIKYIAERVAANIVNLGQHIRDSAAHLLVNLGYQIHQLL